MGFLTDWLTDWLKELLIEGIMGNLTGLFDTVNSRVGEIAVQVGTTPAAWNAGVFSLIRQLSETVILPIAGLILTFVATYELLQLIIEKNNLHDLDYWIFFKWIFKTACAILILSNTFNIVMAVFDVSQSVIARAAGIVQGSTDISEAMLADLEATLETLGLGSLLGLWLQSLLIHVTMWAINIVIFVIVYGRMIEIPIDQLSAYPRCHALQPGTGQHRAELFEVPVCRRLSRAADPCLRCHLCGADTGHRYKRRPHRRDMGVHGLFRAALLLPVQNRLCGKEHLRRTLKNYGPIWPVVEIASPN